MRSFRSPSASALAPSALEVVDDGPADSMKEAMLWASVMMGDEEDVCADLITLIEPDSPAFEAIRFLNLEKEIDRMKTNKVTVSRMKKWFLSDNKTIQNC